MLSVPTVVTVLPSASYDALSMSNAQLPAQVCSGLRRQQVPWSCHCNVQCIDSIILAFL